VPPIGASPDGDLQLGWLRAVASDPVERPVFLDSRRQSKEGNCALYALLDGDGKVRLVGSICNVYDYCRVWDYCLELRVRSLRPFPTLISTIEWAQFNQYISVTVL
jgi:hypothetical protein